jgi:hypothetical protein
LISTVSTVIFPQARALRFLAVAAVTGGVATAGAALAAPIRADMVGNAFLAALTRAGVPYSQPVSTTALGQSVCPMLVQPGASFESVAAKMADGHGMSLDAAGVFTVIAVATYCPAMMTPL